MSGPFKPGPDPRRGRGPPKGSGGRPPDALKALMRESQEMAVKAIRRQLRRHEKKPFLMPSELARYCELLSRYVVKPESTEPQELEVSGDLNIHLHYE